MVVLTELHLLEVLEPHVHRSAVALLVLDYSVDYVHASDLSFCASGAVILVCLSRGLLVVAAKAGAISNTYLAAVLPERIGVLTQRVVVRPLRKAAAAVASVDVLVCNVGTAGGKLDVLVCRAAALFHQLSNLTGVGCRAVFDQRFVAGAKLKGHESHSSAQATMVTPLPDGGAPSRPPLPVLAPTK